MNLLQPKTGFAPYEIFDSASRKFVRRGVAGVKGSAMSRHVQLLAYLKSVVFDHAMEYSIEQRQSASL